MIGAIVAGGLSAPTPPVTNSYESLQTYLVPSGGSSSITFSSIPSTYKHLQIRSINRGTNGTGITSPKIRFNSDSSSNYAMHLLEGDGSSASAYALSSQTYMWFGVSPRGSVSSSVFAATVTDILDYTSTAKNKTIKTLSGIDANGSGYLDLQSGLWFKTPEAITSITIEAESNQVNFAEGSSFALYGIKG